MSSFQSQYGIRLSKELDNMKWAEFSALLSGLGPDTPLGRIVAIRSENDKDILKNFTRDQHRIRNEYRKKQANNMNQIEYDTAMNNLEKMFSDLCK